MNDYDTIYSPFDRELKMVSVAPKSNSNRLLLTEI
jgi:hypothetical protein